MMELTEKRLELVKEGLMNYRFEYLTSFKDTDDGEYVWMSLSPSREYFIVETEHSRTKYYKRFSDAIRYFKKNMGDKETWIDLSYGQEETFGTKDDSILIEDLDWVEKDDLFRA